MSINKIFWKWVPCVSVGPFQFGTPINNYVKQYELYEEDEYYRLTGEKRYFSKLCNFCNNFKDVSEYLTLKYDHSFTIYTKKSLINDIRIETYLYYNNCDIIGKSLDKVIKIIGRSSWDDEDSQDVIDQVQQIYYFYDMGLTLWTFEGKVVTAFCDDGKDWIKE
jgi:hypothetical protein